VAFVRAKHQGDRTYYYLVETYREGGRVRQRALAYLGEYPKVEEAVAQLPRRIELRAFAFLKHGN